MPAVALTGSDVLIINDQQLTAFGDGDVAMLDFPNELNRVKVGKNGNVTIALDNNGKLMNVTVRLLRGSPDDAFLNGLEQEYLQDPPSFELLSGQFVKRVGDGQGNVINDTYIANLGNFRKLPGAKDNADGDTEQAIVVWELFFAQAIRAEQ